MKELIHANFQITRATGAPTTFTVDGVSIEMRKRGAAVKAKSKAKKPRRLAKASKAKASKPKETPQEQPAKGRSTAPRREQAAPQ